MNLIYFNRQFIRLFVYFLLLSGILMPIIADSSTAFFYGRPMPEDLLSHFKQVVVEPENIDDIETLHAKGTEIFAYISIGEVNSTRSWYSKIPQNWFFGHNKEWGSRIIDLTQQGWHDYLVNTHLARLWEEGYRGFFFDTLDSYQRVVDKPEDRRLQEKALSSLIKRIYHHFPGIKLILNRGFEILPAVGDYAVGMAAESLFQSWNQSKQKYSEVDESDRNWLLEKLREARNEYGLQVIVIDYVDPKQRGLARKTAKQIVELGFTPWVANPGLDMLGVGELEVFPRRILALYNGRDHPEGLQQTEVHRLLATPLEYLGYTLHYLDVNEGLPTHFLTGQYAGIVTWFNNDTLLKPRRYQEWLLQQIDAGVKIAIFGSLGFKADDSFLQQLGVKSIQSIINEPLKIEKNDEIVGYEAKPYPKMRGLTTWQTLENGIQKHLSLLDQTGQNLVAVFTGEWGGVALNPYVIEKGYNGRQRWIINPFKFFSKALDLPSIPIPDVTTENGRRLLLVQIDGDGAGNTAEIPGTPLAIKVIQSHILEKYELPTTVSIIEGEVTGSLPEKKIEIEKVARTIFKQKNVEIASHSYSHPLAWFPKNHIDARGDDYHFSINGYDFNLNREIVGSVDYINDQLAPENKRTRVFIWTGDAIAGKEALELSGSIGLQNINGGGASITQDELTITRVPPLGYAIQDQFQIYAPIASDQIYTNNWQGPFYGFNRVIETMRLTDRPLRLKPLHIHYHFYSGSKIASVKALKSVYDWSIKQESRAIWVSEYAQKAKEFQNITLSRRIDGAWNIKGLNTLRTVRLPATIGWPDYRKSKGVIGMRDVEQGRYLHLLPNNDHALLHTTLNPSKSSPFTFLVHSNGEIKKWEWIEKGAYFHMYAHMPLELVITSPKRECHINWAGGKLTGLRQNQNWKFVFPTENPGAASLICT